MMDQLRALLDKARVMWEGLDRNRKIGVAGGAGALLILMLLLTASGGKEQVSYLPLYTDLDLREAGKLSVRLREMDQDFKVGGDGSVIMVPEDARLSLRASLAAEGYPRTGLIGYEVFDEVPLGMTDFLQKVKMRQALEGELQRTLLQLEQVEEVRLHVVMPEPSLFTDQEKPPTASLMLKLRHRMTLSRDQVEGIQLLVAGSVEGLSLRNITIVDTEGNVLSEEGDPIARVSSKQIEIQRDVEAYLEERTQSILDRILGNDQAFVRLHAELDFAQTEEEVKQFDPNTAVLRSEQRTEQNSAEAGTNETSVSNYEINETIKRISGAPGSIRRVSVSLMINQRVPDKIENGIALYKTRTAAEIQEISNIVRGALGIDLARGDQLQISSFEFAIQDLRFAAEAKREAEARDELIENIVINIAKGIAIVIALLVLRAIIGAIGRGVAREEEIAMEAQRELASDDISEELPETPHEILLGRIASLISERPEDAAKLIRTMLIEDARSRPA